MKFIPKLINFIGYIHYDVLKLSFGERIKTIRQSLGMTGRELAKELGIHPDTLFSWEKGEHKPTRKLKKRLK